MIQPLPAPSFTLGGVLTEVTKRNLHSEVTTGEPTGREAWQPGTAYSPDRGDIVRIALDPRAGHE